MNNKSKIKELLKYSPHLNEEFTTIAINEIYSHKNEFEELFNSTQKLEFVKRLKNLTGGGLKECKDIADLYWEGKIMNSIKEDRRIKLEQLAKVPLINELISKIQNLNKDELHSLLMKIDVDDLLDIDDMIDEL